jgi:crossover junction endodeoxyribonuclease RuvC
MTRLLGIDPGSRQLGWGIVDAEGSRLQHVAHGVIAAPATLDLPERLAKIFSELEDVIARYHPDTAAIEQVFTARGPKAALVLGQARGTALVALQRGGLAIGEYAPAEVKLAVAGHGRASKEQLANMVGRLLGLDVTDTPLDATDALAIAICHAHGRARGRLVELARKGAR